MIISVTNIAPCNAMSTAIRAVNFLIEYFEGMGVLCSSLWLTSADSESDSNALSSRYRVTFGPLQV